MRMYKKIIKEVLSWVLVFAVSIGLAFLINKTLIYNVSSPTGSMEDTIMIGDRVTTLRTAYTFSNPKRGDIIVFPYPDNEEEDLIKRIIGLPGETIEGKDGFVYIDGEKLEEDYVMSELAEDFGPYEIPEDSYFMMGDNRSISFDARYWTNKFVHRDKIRGKALFKYPDFKSF